MPLPAPPRRRGRALTITVVTAVLALLGGLAAWIGPFGGKEDGGAANPTDGSSVPESPGPSTETDGGATDPRIPDGTTSMLRSGATYEDVAFCLYTSDNLVEDEGYDNVLGWDCDDTDEEFTFVASEDDPDVYRITTESNGCVLGDPDAEEHYDTVLRYEDCPDDPFAWRVKVLSVEEGELTVEIEHIGSERCLTVDEAHMSAHKPYVVLDTCAGTEHQEWTAEVD